MLKSRVKLELLHVKLLEKSKIFMSSWICLLYLFRVESTCFNSIIGNFSCNETVSYCCFWIKTDETAPHRLVSQSDHPRGFDTAKAITYPPMSWWKTNGLYQVIFLCHYFFVEYVISSSNTRSFQSFARAISPLNFCFWSSALKALLLWLAA